jgi:hypothetical protein
MKTSAATRYRVISVLLFLVFRTFCDFEEKALVEKATTALL